jgi:valyl-tRNA synthetase
METGYDILFFWVARMILMTTYATGQIPFKTVYLHGLIRTRDGKKMSKSDPSTMIDPLDIIPKFGADALRLSMIVGQSPGADSKLFEEKIAGYRNFVNKLWNASRFVLMQCVRRLGFIPKIFR